MAHHRGFSGARFARQNQESTTRFNSKHQFSERNFVRSAGKQEARIGGNVKWILLQSEGAKHVVKNGGRSRRGH